jgi:hypothetical protein
MYEAFFQCHLTYPVSDFCNLFDTRFYRPGIVPNSKCNHIVRLFCKNFCEQLMNSFQTFNSNIRNEGSQRSLIFNKISKERYLNAVARLNYDGICWCCKAKP